MHQRSRFSSMLRSEVGINQYIRHTFDSRVVFDTRIKLSYVNEQPFHTGRTTSNIVGMPGSFSVNSFTAALNLISPSVEFSWKNKKGGHFSIAYDGEFGAGAISNEILARAGIYF
jgi:hypothetical protein